MKTIEAQVEKIGSRLQLTCQGERSYDAYIQLIDAIRSELDKDKEIKKVLVDLCKVTGDLSTFERHLVGKYLAEKLPYGIRMAVVSSEKHLVGMVENTAVNRGVQIFSTPNKEKAVTWLGD
jgi:hypothetical protein